MNDLYHSLNKLVEDLRACRRCPQMQFAPVSGGPVLSRVMLVGQAPGSREPQMGRPFAWTAGQTLFKWFSEVAGVNEHDFRSTVYMAAVCRCFPGKTTAGDRVPSRIEIENCSSWLDAEIALLAPRLVIPVGKLAIAQFFQPAPALTDVIGKIRRTERAGKRFDVVALPHPSGASPWHRIEPGKSLTRQALELIRDHPAWKKRVSRRGDADPAEPYGLELANSPHPCLSPDRRSRSKSGSEERRILGESRPALYRRPVKP